MRCFNTCCGAGGKEHNSSLSLSAVAKSPCNHNYLLVLGAGAAIPRFSPMEIGYMPSEVGGVTAQPKDKSASSFLRHTPIFSEHTRQHVEPKSDGKSNEEVTQFDPKSDGKRQSIVTQIDPKSDRTNHKNVSGSSQVRLASCDTSRATRLQRQMAPPGAPPAWSSRGRHVKMGGRDRSD